MSQCLRESLQAKPDREDLLIINADIAGVALVVNPNKVVGVTTLGIIHANKCSAISSSDLDESPRVVHYKSFTAGYRHRQGCPT